MVDCGVTFEDTLQGNEVQMPDPHFISQRVYLLSASSRPMPTGSYRRAALPSRSIRLSDL